MYDHRPDIEIVEDAIYIPFVLKKTSAPNVSERFHGGVYRPDGSRIVSCDLRRKHGALSTGADKINPDSLQLDKTMPGTTLLQSFNFKHYGHFLIESLSRLWAYDLAPGSRLLILSPQQRRQLQPYQQEFYSLLDIAPENICFCSKPTRFERLIIPDTAFQIRSYAHKCFRDPFESAATRLRTESGTGSKLYISRSRWSRGAVNGELEFESILEKEGFEVIHPQELSLVEQIRAYARASVFVGVIGSAMHNLLFSLDPKMVVYLTGRDRVNLNYFLVDAIKGVSSVYGRVNKDAENATNRNDSWTLDVDQAVEILRKRDLI